MLNSVHEQNDALLAPSAKLGGGRGGAAPCMDAVAFEQTAKAPGSAASTRLAQGNPPLPPLFKGGRLRVLTAGVPCGGAVARREPRR